MSRSTTYRRVVLTAEQRAELAAQRRTERLHPEATVLPQLAGTEETDALDDVVAGECRDRTVRVVLESLAAMGYQVNEALDDSAGLTILAGAADGRAAEVSVMTADGGVVVTPTFTDPGDAVPEWDPHAGEICEQAVKDQMILHRALGDAEGLDAGRIEADGRPTRGTAAARRRARRTAGQRAARARARRAR